MSAPSRATELLLDAIDLWCARNGCTASEFGRMASPHPFPGFVGLLRRRLWVKPETATRVRAFMAHFPNGCSLDEASAWRAAGPDTPPPALPQPSIRDDIQIEAEAISKRRRVAARIGLHSKLATAAPIPDGTIETLQTLMIDSPAEAARVLQRRWPDIWRALLVDARRANVTPVRHLVALLSHALAVEEAEAA